MAKSLQESIDHAAANPGGAASLVVEITVSVHDDAGAVLAAEDDFRMTASGVDPGDRPTFHPDLPLRDWGPARIVDRAVVTVGSWFNRPKPGFSTRGQGGMTLNVAATGAHPHVSPIPIDVSVRRDPGIIGFLSFPGLGPSVQMEIEKLSGPGGTATSGVTLRAVEDGALLRAVGPSMRDPASNASYTVTISAQWVPG
jgi:hypothetical protein